MGPTEQILLILLPDEGNKLISRLSIEEDHV
jgi:hypothetical protein